MGYIVTALYLSVAGTVTVGLYELTPRYYRHKIMDFIQNIGGDNE